MHKLQNKKNGSARENNKENDRNSLKSILFCYGKLAYFVTILFIYLLFSLIKCSHSFFNFLALGQEIKEINTQIGYILTYDNQGGTGCTYKTQTKDKPWGDLCTPTKSGMQFQGWYTGENGQGTNITSNTTATQNLTVYAKWGYPMLTMQDYQSTNILGHTFIKEDVEIINIVNNINIPNSVESWDVSANQDGSIVAWVKDDNSNDKYELYIGFNYNKIMANNNSGNLFRGFKNVTQINGLDKLDTSQALNMNNMFNECSNLTTLDLSNFNTSHVSHMSYMFYDCSSLTTLNLSNFDTGNVVEMQGLFYKCSSLTTLNLSSFNTTNVVRMFAMFCDCSSLTTLDLLSFNTNKVIDMSAMFFNCNSLISLNISNFSGTVVTDTHSMFYNCNSLTTLNFGNFGGSNITDSHGMFRNCSSLTTLDLSSFNTNKVINMAEMFLNCSSLTNLNISSFSGAAVTDTHSMFNNCNSLTTLNFGNFGGSNITDSHAMFLNCSSLTVLDLSSFTTLSITDTRYMFSNCTNLSKIYVDSDKWDMNAVTTSTNMFTGSSNLVGGNGTTYNANYVDKTYAHVDVPGNPGYLTEK